MTKTANSQIYFLNSLNQVLSVANTFQNLVSDMPKNHVIKVLIHYSGKRYVGSEIMVMKHFCRCQCLKIREIIYFGNTKFQIYSYWYAIGDVTIISKECCRLKKHN